MKAIIITIIAAVLTGCSSISNKAESITVSAGERIVYTGGFAIEARNREPLTIKPKFRREKVGAAELAEIRAKADEATAAARFVTFISN